MVSSVDGLAGAVAVPQRREVASEAVTGGWEASRPSTLRDWLARHIVAARLRRSAKTGHLAPIAHSEVARPKSSNF